MIASFIFSLYLHQGSIRPTFADGCVQGIPIPLEVIEIGGTDRHGKPLVLEKEAAEAFLDLRSAMMSDGIEISLNYAYRTMEQQTRLYRKNRRLANPPGLSTHQEGRAIDVSGCTRRIGKKKVDTKVCRWLRKHGHKYGFSRTTAREPWHWEFGGRPEDSVASRSF
jgi:LAS superfamily LD-carboxypeptidase LdcB